jgi:hypothetical protein
MGYMGKPRKNPVADEQIVAAYKACLSVYQVNRELGVSTSTIYRVLERNGVERVGLAHYRNQAARFNRKQAERLRALRESGVPYADLVKQFGGTEYSVKRAIRSVGGDLVPVCARWTDTEVAEILRRYANRESQMNISLALNRSQSFVSRVLRRNRVKTRDRVGPSHSMWKGGRITVAGGYIKVKMDESDPLAVQICDSNGYVYEHRLVMSHMLGRPLTAKETVHHINGNKADNRPENLELHHSRHGKGVAMQCLDCGSRHVGFAPLKKAN